MNNGLQSVETASDRFHGIEYLRAVMSVFVVLWHMGGVGHSFMFSKARFFAHEFSVSDLVNFHVLLLAVPVFVLISNFLLAYRDPGPDYIRKRLGRLDSNDLICR